MKSEKKKNPTSSTAKKTDAGLPMNTPKRSGTSLPPVVLPIHLGNGVAELVRLTGLDEAAVVRHCLSSALLWCGLNGYGRRSFEFLAETTMGKDGAQEFIEQATEIYCAIEMEGAMKVAYQREREADAAFPDDWPTEA